MGVPGKKPAKAASLPDTAVPLSGDERNNALGEINKVVDRPGRLNGEALRGDTRLTQRWVHGGLHHYLPAMTGHAIMTYYGAAQEISWSRGPTRLASLTRPGSITLIPEGHDGRWDIARSLEVSHVYLSEHRLQNCAELLGRGQRIELLDRVGFDDPAAARIMEILSQPSVTADTASRLFVEQAVDLLCIQLVRAHSSIGALPQSRPPRGLADWQVKRVIGYMREFIDRDIGLEEMAALAGLSRFHFATAFRLATGMSPHHYLTQLRMVHARKLLAEPGLSMIQIALAVGYQTPSAFAASFRKATHVTPSAFRRGL